MNIAAIIGIMIAIVVGVNFFPWINTAIGSAEGSAVSGLAAVLPIIFIAVIILGAVAWMGGTDTGIPSGIISNRFFNAIKIEIRKHRKLCYSIVIFGVISILLQLATYMPTSLPQ